MNRLSLHERIELIESYFSRDQSPTLAIKSQICNGSLPRTTTLVVPVGRGSRKMPGVDDNTGFILSYD